MDISELMSFLCESLALHDEYDSASSDNDNDSGEIYVEFADGSEFVIRINEI